MKRIILDTNFLTVPYQLKVDIFEEIDKLMEEDYELATLNGVIEELKKLSKSKGRDSIAAQIALELIKRKNVKIINTEEKKVDSAILKIADENTIIATNDKNLRKKIKNKNLKALYLRSKKRLEMG
jgi:rRNA-processing protein FCF1